VTSTLSSSSADAPVRGRLT